MEGKTLALGAAVTLRIPADRSMMLVARLTAAAVLARAGVSADKLDEMKMAVEEALTCLLQAGGISQAELRFTRLADGLSIELTGVPGPGAASGISFDEEELTVVRCILETMADEVVIREEGGAVRSIALFSRCGA